MGFISFILFLAVAVGPAVLLGVVLFGVPVIKTIYFMKASITEGGLNGSIIFGSLGYCLQLSNGTTCSNLTTSGYELGQFLHST